MGIGHILPRWPPDSELFELSQGSVRPRVGRLLSTPHVPRWHIDHFRCSRCLRKVSEFTETPCRALAPSLLRGLRTRDAFGHRLNVSRVAGSDAPAVRCVRRGRYGTSRALSLGKKCVESLTSKERRQLMNGKLPQSPCLLHGALPMNESALARCKNFATGVIPQSP